MSDFEDFDFPDLDESGDADILENFEDSGDSKEELSSVEINRRIDAYEAKTQKNMQIIVKAKQFNKSQRLEAIQWLGESGNPKAIPNLIKVYQKDKTPGMKEAAAYALGQFRAYKQDDDDPEMQDIANQRIDDIILYNKVGKRASATLFIILEIVLLILAVALFSVGGIFSVQNANMRATQYIQATTDAPTWTPDTEDAVQSDLERYYADLVADATFYQQQMAAVGRGEGLNCDLSLLIEPRNYTLTELWQNNSGYANLVTELNDINAQMSEVSTAYHNSCSSGIILARQEALDLGGVVINVQRALTETRNTLNNSGIEVTEQVFASATPAPTNTPDPLLATETQDISVMRDVILELERIVDDMTFNGATTSIIFNWQQVVDNGEIYRSGCNQPEPLIPQDYSLPAELVATSAQLDAAVNNVNIGLQSTRLAVTAFYESCTAGEIPEDASGRLAQAQLAQAAFESARNDLNALQGR